MPFTFKLSKRLALSKAVLPTAARELSALRRATSDPALVVTALPYSRSPVAENTTSLVGLFAAPATPLL